MKLKEKIKQSYWNMDPASALVGLLVAVLVLGYLELCWG